MPPIRLFAAIFDACARIDSPDGSRHILRLHRPGYQSRAAIESELASGGELYDVRDVASKSADNAARLAALAGVDQSFVRCDVLSDQSATNSKWGTVVALHACGSLHRHLLRQGIAEVDTTFFVAPCCYHLGFVDDYPTFNSQATLRLSHSLTRIAVAQTCTANGHDRRARQRLQSWKLGIQALRRAIMGPHDGVVLAAIPAAWARGDFRGFCARVAARQQWDLPASIDWDYWEREGLRRLNEVRRLELIRCSFRRMIELWLVWDMATALQQEGREVEVGTFCDVAVSPRNILIIARPAG